MTGEVIWLIGEGPNTKPDEAPAYTDILDPGPWRLETAATTPTWHGNVTCPACNATVLNH